MNANSKAILWTPEIGKFVTVITGWMHAGYSGGFVYGIQRTGKSQGVMYAQFYLPTVFRNVIVVTGSCVEVNNKATPSTLLRSCLQRRGHPSLLGNGGVLVTRLISDVYAEAKQKSASQVLLIVDEAQWLGQTGCVMIQHFTNELDARGLSTCVVLIGQTELRGFERSLRHTLQANLLARNFLHEYHFQGIAWDDLKIVFEALDETADGADMASCYMGAHAPLAVRAGLRMRPSHDLFTQAIEAAFKKALLPEKYRPRIPMEYIMSSVRHVATRVERLQCPEVALAPATWAEALGESGFVKMLTVHVAQATLAAKAAKARREGVTTP